MLSAEVIALAGLVDDALGIRKQLEFILKLSMALHMLTDSNNLLKIISKGSFKNEKRIILEIYVADE